MINARYRTRTDAVVVEVADEEHVVAHGVHLAGHVVSERAQVAEVATVSLLVDALTPAPCCRRKTFKRSVKFPRVNAFTAPQNRLRSYTMEQNTGDEIHSPILLV